MSFIPSRIIFCSLFYVSCFLLTPAIIPFILRLGVYCFCGVLRLLHWSGVCFVAAFMLPNFVLFMRKIAVILYGGIKVTVAFVYSTQPGYPAPFPVAGTTGCREW
jgi:hypothetical protein